MGILNCPKKYNRSYVLTCLHTTPDFVSNQSADFSAFSKTELTYQFPLCPLYTRLRIQNLKLKDFDTFHSTLGKFSTSAHSLLFQQLEI